MADVIAWPPPQPQEVIDLALSLLAAGQLIAVPTEAGYEVIAVANPQTLERLEQTSAPFGTGQGAWRVGVGDLVRFRRWLPGLGHRPWRLVNRAWPGPLILVGRADFQADPDVPDYLRQRLAGQDVAFRCPAHEAVLCLLQRLPLLMSPPMANLESLLASWGDYLGLILKEDTDMPLLDPTIVRVAGNAWDTVHAGALSASALTRLTACHILFVCSGNTCRSPLAQALCVKLLAERLGCAPEDLPERGFVVQSAGLAAYPDDAASPGALAVAQELGIDLGEHRSRRLTQNLLMQADYILTMTQGHLQALAGYNDPGGPRLRLLAPTGTDIVDPIGSTNEAYRLCAQQICQALEVILPDLQAEEVQEGP